MANRDDLLRFLHGELRTLEKMLDKPLPLGSAADRKAALRSVRAMRERVWNEGRAPDVWGTSTVSTPEYQQEQREKNQRARDLVDGLARKG